MRWYVPYDKYLLLSLMHTKTTFAEMLPKQLSQKTDSAGHACDGLQSIANLLIAIPLLIHAV